MTDGQGTAGDDLQRPLDESVPVDAGGARPAAEPETTNLETSGPEISAISEPAPTTETTLADPEPATAGLDAATASTDDGDAPAGESGLASQVPPETVPLRTAVPAETAGLKSRVINLDTTVAQVVRHARTWPPVRMARATGRASLRGGRRVVAWSHRPSGRFVVPGLVLAALIAGAVAAGAFVIPMDGVADRAGPTDPGGTGDASLPGIPPTALPPVTDPFNPGAPPATGGFTGVAGNPTEALTGWAQTTATLTGIPMIAQRAYGYAELVMATTTPTCQLRWTTLAAIGQVESNHGSAGGSSLLPDGRALPAITGPPLNGQGGTVLIQDTDGGQLDADAIYDRAVGPMQFIPGTWYIVADPLRGISDVHNINDAALAAAYYLCGQGRNLSTPEDWWAAILSYNNVQTYANAVFGYANQYGERSRGGSA